MTDAQMMAFYGSDTPSERYKWGLVVPEEPGVAGTLGKWCVIAWFKTRKAAEAKAVRDNIATWSVSRLYKIRGIRV